MRLLIVNFEMDEDSGVLAWQADVVRALARRCEFVFVLTQKQGRFEAPENVTVVEVPVRPFGIPQRLGGRWLMNPMISRICRDHRIDACFVHMAMEWVYILAPALRRRGVPVLFWYAHGTVSLRLRLALLLAGAAVTSTAEGLRLKSRKVNVIGQGVDADLFSIPSRRGARNDLIYVGRISRRKRIELLVETMDALRRLAPDSPIRLQLVGPLLTPDDHAYNAEIRALVASRNLGDRVVFRGFVKQRAIPRLYEDVFLHVNVSCTGSMDKTVVEALSSGCPVLTSNEAFFGLLSGHPELVLRNDDPSAIAESILALHSKRDAFDPVALRALVVGQHDLRSWAGRVCQILARLVA